MTETGQTAPEQQPKPAAKGRVRWWPAALILLAALALWMAAISATEINRQDRYIRTFIIWSLAGILLLAWAVLFSGLARKWRFAALGVAAGGIVLGAALFEIRGVTGDFVPILEFRWKKPSVAADSQPSAAPSAVAELAEKAPSPKAQNYPQFLGPDRDAKVDGPELARDWTTRPPEELWRQPVGAAWSGFVVVGSLAITQEQRGDSEMVVCYELATGRQLWSHANNARYFTTIAGEGPRATPAIDGDRVYAQGATGILNCLELATGRRIWNRNILEENGAKVNDWGVACSPLIVHDLVVVNPGGTDGRSLVAYRKDTGEFVWGGGNDRASYSSPTLEVLDGVPQILIFNHRALFSHDPATGKVLWSHPWGKGQPHVALPVRVSENRLLVSSGYGIGCELLEVKRDEAGKWSVNRLYKTLSLKAKFNNYVKKGDYIYGLDDGIMVCLDIASGERKWKDGRYGHGQMILAGDLLVLMAENGDVVLLEPVPEAHRELARFTAFKAKTWNPPALAGPYLLIRNDQEAACYRLPLASKAAQIAR